MNRYFSLQINCDTNKSWSKQQKWGNNSTLRLEIESEIKDKCMPIDSICGNINWEALDIE